MLQAGVTDLSIGIAEEAGITDCSALATTDPKTKNTHIKNFFSIFIFINILITIFKMAALLLKELNININIKTILCLDHTAISHTLIEQVTCQRWKPIF